MSIKAGAIMFVLGAFASVASAQTAPTNKCDFFENFDYKGKTAQLHTGHVLSVAANPAVSEEYSKGRDYKLFVAPEWKGIMSSLKVGPGCVADVVAGGKSVTVDHDLPSFDANYNDKVDFVGCRCKPRK
jgi:hypothetical protein